jgi:hypothetical protein
MFRQIAPNGIVNKMERTSQLHGDETEEHDHQHLNLRNDVSADAVTATHEEMRRTVSAECPFLGGQAQPPSKHEYTESVVTASGDTTEEKLAAQEKGELAPGHAVSGQD